MTTRPIIYDDGAGVTRCSTCQEPILREWASIQEDSFASVRRLTVWCSLCDVMRVEERHLECEECPQYHVGGTA
ncbi:hypothetical protein MYX64_08550, partial [Nitrospinae bacterium AH_259_B05_G02_I21]|nr:hypothetical protein [Nitrospinae bacterium AH_259_B05_G02_I21]